MELLFLQKDGSASFGTKMVLSLNGVDPSCMNSITGSTCRANYSNISHDRKDGIIHSQLKNFELGDLRGAI